MVQIDDVPIGKPELVRNLSYYSGQGFIIDIKENLFIFINGNRRWDQYENLRRLGHIHETHNQVPVALNEPVLVLPVFLEEVVGTYHQYNNVGIGRHCFLEFWVLAIITVHAFVGAGTVACIINNVVIIIVYEVSQIVRIV